MTGRFNVNNPQPPQMNRMRAPNRASVQHNSSPVFGNSSSVSAYSPAYYESATTKWKRISAVEFEQSIYKQVIVRAPDFDRPHEDATLAVIHLNNGIKLAIQLRAWDTGSVAIQRLLSITRSKVRLSGSLGLQSYQHPAGPMSLDLIVQTSTGPHTIARTHTETPDWVLGFYKETR